MLCKMHFLKKFAKFTGKHLSPSLFFNKVADLHPATLLTMGYQHWRFPVNFAKTLKTPFLHKNSLHTNLELIQNKSEQYYEKWKNTFTNFCQQQIIKLFSIICLFITLVGLIKEDFLWRFHLYLIVLFFISLFASTVDYTLKEY